MISSVNMDLTEVLAELYKEHTRRFCRKPGLRNSSSHLSKRLFGVCLVSITAWFHMDAAELKGLNGSA
jgi:hypothetical protein